MSKKIVGIVSVVIGIVLMLVFVIQASFLNTVTISFDSGLYGEDIESIQVTASESPNLPSLSLDGYTFDGWFLEDSFENPASILVLNRESRTIYAKFTPNVYTIDFEARGGDIVSSITADYNSTVEEPAAPTRPGYTFDGWYSDQALTQVFEFDTMPLNGETLYAKWTAVPFTLSYVLTPDSENSSLNPDDYTIEDDVVVLDDPIREGYTFKGWYLDAETTEPISFVETNDITELTLYAKWEINTYTLSFDFGKGEDEFTQGNITAPYATDISAEFPTEGGTTPLEGYTFEGWYFDSEFTELFDGDTMPAFDGTLYALYTPIEYAITYNLDSGANGVNPEIYTIESDTIVLDEATKSGYSFDGWYTDDSYTTEVIIIDSGSIDDIELYAKFDIITYDITYELDASTNSENNPDTYVVTDTTITLANPEKVGHTFNGWFADDAYTTQVTEIDPAGVTDVTVYAKWTINTYNVTFDINNDNVGPLTTETAVLEFASSLQFESPVLDGWTLEYWEDQDGLVYNTGNLMPAKDATFTAVWTENEYFLNFYLFDDKYVNDERFDFDIYHYNSETITAPADPIRNGYQFLGWIDPTTEDYYTFEGTWSDPDLEEFGLYADWQILTFTITYILDEDESNDPDNPTIYDVEDNQLFNPPTKPGYDFDMWVNTDNNTEKDGVDGDFVALTLEPRWTLATYTITYKDGDNTLTSTGNTSEFDIETSTFTLTGITKPGYDFLGWYDNSEFDGSAISSINPSVTPQDLTLYAKWEAGEYNLSIDANGGSGVTEGTFGYLLGEAISLSTPTRTGYTFLGWYDGTTRYYDEDLMPMSDVDLVAKWSEGTYSISYTVNQSNEVLHQTDARFPYDQVPILVSCNTSKTGYNYEDDTFLLPVCSKPGWNFDGWYDNAEFTGSPITEITKNSTTNYDLHAKWTQKEYVVTFIALDPSDYSDNPLVNTATINNNDQATWTVTYHYGDYVDRPSGTRDGYHVSGHEFITGASYTYTYYAYYMIGIEGSATEDEGNYEVKLNWELNTYSLTFDANYTDANNAGNWTYTYDGLTIESKIDVGFPPYRPGYTFLGWYDAETGGNLWTEDDYMKNEDMTLYAQWQPNAV
jgi:uncharacterized repeat protein (TIGR02543 family)